MDPKTTHEQPIIQHLLELRTRLLRSLLVVVVIFFSLFAFANDIYEFVAQPLQQFLPENSTMIATDVASPFLTPFKLTLLVSLFLSMPFILFQIWSFIAPALYKHEKRIAMPLFIASVMLFYAGIAFAYYVVFPLAFKFFMSVAPDSIAAMPDISSYLSFVLKIIFGFGIAFEVPVITIMLIAAGIISADGLAKKRPYVIVGCFVMGMFLTPPDVISQVMLAFPMWLLFEFGLFFGRILSKKEAQENEAESE
ncbi:MAG: twin-arginine translocase subunit TatC [Agarilytica sp.]